MRALVRLSALILGAAIVLAAAGCSENSAPRHAPRVQTINGNEPLQSDVVTSEGGVIEDEVIVEIWNTPHDPVLDLYGTPFNAVWLERYEIVFESDEAIPPVSGALGWHVDTSRVMSGSIVIVPAAIKIEAPLVSLRDGGVIQTTARITFFGRETGSDEEVRFSTVLQVNFANWAD